MSIKSNLDSIINAISKEVQLVAVTKTRSLEELQELYNCGQKVFGENRVQELLLKHENLPNDIQWHLIGHLQTNKVKFIVPFVALIHSVDSEKLLAEINKQAQKINKKIAVLLQVFIAKEETKFGWEEQELMEFLVNKKYKNYPNIDIVGLMGMATNTENVEQVKNEFLYLKSIFHKAEKEIENSNFKIISMGMSNDYKLAIECGSNMIRVGSAMFN
ncbi:MAG: YggS family pyridoxal phosphate-dependent enzyme [Bacteroidia bacterium]